MSHDKPLHYIHGVVHILLPASTTTSYLIHHHRHHHTTHNECTAKMSVGDRLDIHTYKCIHRTHAYPCSCFYTSHITSTAVAHKCHPLNNATSQQICFEITTISLYQECFRPYIANKQNTLFSLSLFGACSVEQLIRQSVWQCMGTTRPWRGSKRAHLFQAPAAATFTTLHDPKDNLLSSPNAMCCTKGCVSLGLLCLPRR